MASSSASGAAPDRPLLSRWPRSRSRSRCPDQVRPLRDVHGRRRRDRSFGIPGLTGRLEGVTIPVIDPHDHVQRVALLPELIDRVRHVGDRLAAAARQDGRRATGHSDSELAAASPASTSPPTRRSLSGSAPSTPGRRLAARDCDDIVNPTPTRSRSRSSSSWASSSAASARSGRSSSAIFIQFLPSGRRRSRRRKVRRRSSTG